MHPYLKQQALVDFCHKNDIVVTAYSPLGSKRGLDSILNDATVLSIAKKLNKTPAQVLLSWGIQRGTMVIPKSVTPERIVQNHQVFVLEQADFEALNALDKGKRFVDPRDWWKVDVFEDAKL